MGNIISDGELHDIRFLIQSALFYREKARTFRTKVGAAIETFDMAIIGGFNIETYTHKGYHAEEVALIRALAHGYNGTDFRRMAVVYQDAGHNDFEVYPACLGCLNYLWDFTHPRFEIFVADIYGKGRYKGILEEMLSLKDGARIYPSENVRKNKPRLNSEPILSVNENR